MFELTKKGIVLHKDGFEAANIRLPAFDVDALVRKTRAAPVWLHVSAGNLFKAFHAALAQGLVEMGLADVGVVAVVPNDFASIGAVWSPHDNLFIKTVMKADGGLENAVIASVAELVAADSADVVAWGRLKEIFRAPSLQMVSLSITEKGYELRGLDGAFKVELAVEFDAGLAAPRHAMTKLAALVYGRFMAGALPLALVSTDNFSHNGDRLKDAMVCVAREWEKRGFVGSGFIEYLLDRSKLGFPLSMIDKITPNPSPKVADALKAAGLAGMDIVRRSRGSPLAPFVNTEEAEYLVVEDVFPNGRPPLEGVGVRFCDRGTVDKVERMKVCTCLNPLHTALAVFGCLLGYASIAEEMRDGDLAALVRRLAEREGLPVVVDPLIINPKAFLAEVLEKRLPNPNIPDAPQRIAADTSQKLAIRFGETIKLWAADEALDATSLTLIPLVIAAWCRYLLALDDEGKPFAPSPDPLLDDLQKALHGIRLGDGAGAKGKLRPILSNVKVVGVDLYEVGLGDKVEAYFAELIAGPGAVRATLKKHLKHL
ncbi:MAG: mannitol dehydrogenase family protein [Spirochaetaceae bacterium]|jgi:fructuronate reductase|nr:mannitol dehydrogenase family protein [Spirochaetaceae bacterium]